MVSLERDIEALPCLGRINSIGLETYVHADSLFYAVEVVFKREKRCGTTFADEDGSVGGGNNIERCHNREIKRVCWRRCADVSADEFV